MGINRENFGEVSSFIKKDLTIQLKIIITPNYVREFVESTTEFQFISKTNIVL